MVIYLKIKIENIFYEKEWFHFRGVVYLQYFVTLKIDGKETLDLKYFPIDEFPPLFVKQHEDA